MRLIPVPPNTRRYCSKLQIIYTDVSRLLALHVTSAHRFLDGTLIVFTNFLLETKEAGTPLEQSDFPSWLEKHREIRSVLSRKTLE
jgi:hypothetical protein